MTEFSLYFVGVQKSGHVLHLEGGPFVSHESAELALSALTPLGGRCEYVVCQTTLPFAVSEAGDTE